jgi:hypothetical protein
MVRHTKGMLATDDVLYEHGDWRIAVRRSTVELAFTADASLLQSEFFREEGYVVGTRNKDDLSYERRCTWGRERRSVGPTRHNERTGTRRSASFGATPQRVPRSRVHPAEPVVD